MKQSRLTRSLSVLTGLILSTIACKGGPLHETSATHPTLSDVPTSVWQTLSTKTIYFGHQSVGYNLMQGVEELQKEQPQLTLKIQDTYDPDDFAPGTFNHSRIGYNGDPESKIRAFSFYMKAGAARKVDYAFFKFCYVDFWAGTDVKRLFDMYQKSYDRLITAYPETTFIHVTVPLATLESGSKAALKTLLGRPLDGTVENERRNEFNALMRKEYGKTPNFFDLATIESTFLDGRRASFEHDGQTYYSLVPLYTNDGGHLNGQGRRLVAGQLLLRLAQLVQEAPRRGSM